MCVSACTVGAAEVTHHTGFQSLWNWISMTLSFGSSPNFAAACLPTTLPASAPAVMAASYFRYQQQRVRLSPGFFIPGLTQGEGRCMPFFFWASNLSFWATEEPSKSLLSQAGASIFQLSLLPARAGRTSTIQGIEHIPVPV